MRIGRYMCKTPIKICKKYYIIQRERHSCDKSQTALLVTV